MNRDEERRRVTKKYSETTEKLFMSISEAELLSVELADRIRENCPNVDCVAGIANGGLMVSTIVAQELNVPLRVLDIRRHGSSIKRLLYKSRMLTATMIALYKIPIIKSLFYWINESTRQLIVRNSGSFEDFRMVAIVDDTIETGKTLEAALQQVTRPTGTTAMTAVLAWSSNYPTPIVKPDIYIGRRFQHYPWSGNNKQYREHVKWLKDREIELVG